MASLLPHAHHQNLIMPLAPGVTLRYEPLMVPAQQWHCRVIRQVGQADSLPTPLSAVAEWEAYAQLRPWYQGYQLTPDWWETRWSGLVAERRLFYQHLFAHWGLLKPDEIQLTQLQKALTEQALLQRCNPQFLMTEALTQLLFANHPYAHPSIGELTAEAISQTYALACQRPVQLWIQDHLPLPELLQLVFPWIPANPDNAPPPPPLPPWPGFQEQTIASHREGAWIACGFRVPGQQYTDWLILYLLSQWWQRIEHPLLADLQVQLTPWRQASLLSFSWYVFNPDDSDTSKTALLQALQRTPIDLQLRQLRQLWEQSCAEWQAIRWQPSQPLTGIQQWLLQHPQQNPWATFEPDLHQCRQLCQEIFHQDNLATVQIIPERQSKTHVIPGDYYQLLPGKRLLRPQVALAPSKPPPPGRFDFKLPNQLTGSWHTWDEPDFHWLGFCFRGGSCLDPPTLEGCTSLLLGVIAQGLLQAAEHQGWNDLNTPVWGVERDQAWLRWQVPTHRWKAALGLLQQVLNSPPWSRALVDNVRRQHLTRIHHHLYLPHHFAEMAFWLNGFNQHPYAHSVWGDHASVQQITPDDLLWQWQQCLHPDRLRLLLLTSFSASELRATLGNTLGSVVLPLSEESDPVAAREILPRRGDIVIQSELPVHLSIGGRILAQPVTPARWVAFAFLQQALTQLEQDSYGVLKIVSHTLNQAWLLAISGPDKQSVTQAWDQWNQQDWDYHWPHWQNQVRQQWALTQQEPHRLWQHLVTWQGLQLPEQDWPRYATWLEHVTPADLQDLLQMIGDEWPEWLFISLKNL